MRVKRAKKAWGTGFYERRAKYALGTLGDGWMVKPVGPAVLEKWEI
jgi:hypothetical protein